MLTAPPVTVAPDAGDEMMSIGAGAAGPTGRAMSVWSSVALNALRYTRTSSIRPLKYSPYRLFPPIHNGLDDTAIAPVRAALARCTPFTNNRTCDPSYVNATCDHAPTGNAFAAGAVTNASHPTKPTTTRRPQRPRL